jgi:heme-binding NEAT domain protein
MGKLHIHISFNGIKKMGKLHIHISFNGIKKMSAMSP